MSVHLASAARVTVVHGRPMGSHVAVAPLPQGEHYGIQVVALLGQPILVARPSAFFIRGKLQHALLDQAVETVGEAAARDAESRAELIEAANAIKGLFDEHERPAIPEHGERPDDRAGLSDQILIGHKKQGIKMRPC